MTLLRTQRFFTTSQMVNLYKARILGYIEYRTPAIFHATQSLLQGVNRIQARFLKAVGISEVEALAEFNLAPLETRRDIAMLGLIQRSVLGKGPAQFGALFEREVTCNNPDGRENRLKHSKQLKSHRVGKYLDVLAHSALGLTDVYNLLPGYIVETLEVQ